MNIKSGLKMPVIQPNIIRQLFFLSIIIGLGYIIFSQLYFMVGAFLSAITLYVIMMKPMKYLVIIKKWKPWLAAIFLMVISFFVMVIPLAYLMSLAIENVSPIIENPTIINDSFNKVHEYLIQHFQIDILNQENAQKVTAQIVPMVQKTLGGTFSALGNIFLMYLILYFLLYQTKQLEAWLRSSLPLKNTNVRKIISGTRNLVYSNAIGIPIVAIIQGIVGLIGYWIFGVEQFLLMGILTAISSVVPIVGTLVVYLPLAIYQFAVAEPWQGIGVALWGFIVIGSIDNVARFLVQKKLADVHPLITLLGVILGINLFGFIGVIFGPLMLSMFFMLLDVYLDEFHVDITKNQENNG